MNDTLEKVYFRNAIRFIRAQKTLYRRRGRFERVQQLTEAQRLLTTNSVTAELSDWLANPFVRTALLILEKFTGNYKIGQAVKLLREAGEEAGKKKGKK